MSKGNSRDILEFLFAGPLFSIFKVLNAIRRELKDVATQAEIDALTQRVNAVGEKQTKALQEVRDEIQKLTNANPSLDVSGLNDAVGRAESGAQELDDVVADVVPEPAPEPESPAEPEAPAEGENP